MATSEHTDREYEHELRTLRERILLMGATVEEMIAGSLRAFVERDADRARRVIEQDFQVNRLEVDTDELCLRILARRQPVASDLRFVTIALKLVTDLERIGDLCVNISERVIELSAEPPLGTFPDLIRMADRTREMLREALDAFVAADVERAERVIAADRTIDAYYAQTFRDLLTLMTAEPGRVARATRIQAIAKYLERIGDHTTNLAEMVVFMVKGKDIRHLSHVAEASRRRVPHGVLFLCVANSARSQMAEGWARHLFPPGVRVWSAGSQPAAGVNPLAVAAMREVGIDIAPQRPKRIADVPLGDIDTVITLCAEEVCVGLPAGLSQQAWVLPDPVAVSGTDAERLAAFRHVRDELRARIEALVRSWS